MSDGPSAFDDLVTPHAGALEAKDHAAFMLRVFQYLVCISPNLRLEVNLQDVLDMTKDKTLMVSLDGPKFTAIAVSNAPPVVKGKLRGH